MAGLRRALATGGLLFAALVGTIAVRTILAGREQALPAIRADGAPVDTAAAARHLSEAIRFATISRDDADPPAAVLARLHAWLATTYPHFHAVALRREIAPGTLIYVWPGRDRSLAPVLLMAHQDVVPAEDGQHWASPPFAGAVRDGMVWGRGAIDDKGSLVAIMEAVESLAAAHVTPRRGLILVFGHDEERGGSGARAAADLLGHAGIRPWFVLDEGSAVIADHPVTGKPAALLGVSEKGYLTIRLVARAGGGHSSAPPNESAVAILSRAVVTLTNRPFPRRYGGATRQMLDALAPSAPLSARIAIANPWLFGGVLRDRLGDSPQGAAMLHTTIAPTMLQASSKENVLADTASATINFRIDPRQSTQDLLDHVRHVLKRAKVAIEIVGRPQEPSPVSPTDGDAWRFLAGVTRGQFAIPIVPAPVIAQTDARSMRGLTASIYRFEPIEMSLADLDMLHGRDERLHIRDLARMIAFYRTLITGPAPARR